MPVSLDFEKQAQSVGFRFIAGVDEVGRGCLAGAVVAAACILDLSKPLPDGLDDSKRLSAKRREELEQRIKETAVAFAVAQVEADEIDQINILQATKKAMRCAIEALTPRPDFLLIDALKIDGLNIPQLSLVNGDAISASIAAASIIAKTYRDRLMREIDRIYPNYGFAKNVGYATKEHLRALRVYGPCTVHRKTFRPINYMISNEPRQNSLF
ncbi:MAG: ribonuclease HII [Acidobacteria bacterium]|nr:MAG: ribonuclease HII [Acidobacteriota bacterium]